MPLDPLIVARDAEISALVNPTVEQVDAINQRPHGPGETFGLEIWEEDAPGPHGPVRLRVHRHPEATNLAPALVWCHGGGFMWGDLEMPESDQVARGIARRITGVVVAVDYRLVGAGNPPAEGVVPAEVENRFPIPHDDVVAAFTHVHQQAARLGIDPDRIAFGGASAGASLISGATLHLRDLGGPLPHVWLPIYPIVHAGLPPSSPALVADLAEASSGFTPEVVDWLGRVAMTEVNPHWSAGEADDLSGLPPCHIINDQYDELRSSGERFAEQLAAAGVNVTMSTAAGMRHGHLNLIGHPVTSATLDEMADHILA